MKKVLALLSLILSVFIFSQELVLTPKNFVSISDESKNYVVLEFPELNQQELYNKSKIFIQSTYKNLKGDGYNEVEHSYIKLRAREQGTKVKLLGSVSIMSYSICTYELYFKDGKIMFKPYLNEFDSENSLSGKTYLNNGNSFMGKSIFNKKGEIWLKNYFEAANNNVNSFISNLKQYLSNEQAW